MFELIEAIKHNKILFKEYTTGVPDGAARQKTRSTGCNYAGWEILALDHLLAGIFVQRLAG